VSLHPNLSCAIAEVEGTFGRDRVTVLEPGDGTAIVTVAGVDVGEKWTPSTVALTIQLAVTFPTTPPYPYYVTAGLQRTDGAAVSNMTANVPLAGHTYNQLSLTNRPMRPDETLSERLLAAIAWFRNL
jgi:hypothetical protein